jgi:hypothetical protein
VGNDYFVSHQKKKKLHHGVSTDFGDNQLENHHHFTISNPSFIQPQPEQPKHHPVTIIVGVPTIADHQPHTPTDRRPRR